MTKDKVLAILLRADGELSGERISEQLNISRVAVSQAVKALRADGYEISAVTNRGYRILNAPDLLREGEVSAYLEDARMERVTVLSETDSTNTRLAELALAGAPNGQVLIADHQAAGRGRMGRSFLSPPGVGIYFSYLIRPEGLPDGTQADLWTPLTSKSAVAVSNAIETVCGVRPRIKWVNDLYLNHRKVCGILTQMDMEQESGYIRSIIVGIGVNVNQQPEDFPEELKGIATSLRMETGKPCNRARIAAEMVKELDAIVRMTSDDEAQYLARYREDSLVIGKEITVSSFGGTKEACAIAVEEDYALRVRYEDGSEEALRGGEISIRPSG